MCPQLAVTQNNPAAVAGQVLHYDGDTHIVEAIAAEIIPYGVGVELDATGLKVQNPKGTGQTPTQFAGIATYPALDQPVIGGVGVGGYQAGDIVKLMRKGRVAIQTVGAAVVATDALTIAGLSHSSTIATDRGKATKSALNGTAGTEIGDVGIKWSRSPVLSGTTNLAAVEINLP